MVKEADPDFAVSVHWDEEISAGSLRACFTRRCSHHERSVFVPEALIRAVVEPINLTSLSTGLLIVLGGGFVSTPERSLPLKPLLTKVPGTQPTCASVM